MTPWKESIRKYLLSRYSAEEVLTGTEATEDAAGHAWGDPDRWVCRTADGWIYAGTSSEIARDMLRDHRA